MKCTTLTTEWNKYGADSFILALSELHGNFKESISLKNLIEREIF
jgi:hypothetical protein